MSDNRLKEETVGEESIFEVGPYRLAADRFYDRESHLWTAPGGGGLLARVGFDPLGSESSGDIVALSFEPVGLQVRRGEAFGTIEAAKFVGPLVVPISGRISGHNEEALASPALVNRRPLDCWMVEIEPDRLAEEVALMVSGRDELTEWFRAEIERFRARGMVAE